MKHCRFLVSSFCMLGLAASAYGLPGGPHRIFGDENGVNPSTTPEAGSIILTSSGATETIDIFTEDLALPTRLNGVQVSMPCSCNFTVSGTATYVPGSVGATDTSVPGSCFLGRYCTGGPNIGLPCTAGTVVADCGAAGLCGAQSPFPVTDDGTCGGAGGLPRAAIAHGTTQPAIVLSNPCFFGQFQYLVSAGAAGDCVLTIPNEPDSGSRDQNDMPIPFNEAAAGGVVQTITLRIPVGQCCDGTTCLGDDFTQSQCQAAGGVFNANNDCNDPCACTSNSDCDDNNGCTSNVCSAGQCVFSPNVPAGQCCNPTGGALTPINDNNECTADSCNPADGSVTHDPAPLNGTACTDDGNPCTLNTCQAGACSALDITGIACTTDAECTAASGGASNTCGGLNAGFCDCVANPPLTIDCAAGEKPNPECFQEGDKVTLTVNVGGGTLNINGGQFRLVYDNTCLDFLSIAPGSACDEGSPYEVEIFEQVNESAGTIFYAVGINLIQNGGSNDGGTLACLSFAKIGACTDCQVCFDDLNPQHTYLSGPGGQQVDPDLPNDGCGCHVQTNGVTTVTVPEGGAFNADCDSPTAIVTWASPAAASDTCDGPLDMVCTCSHTNPLVTDCSSLIANGGEFPQGTAEFECCATDSCGVESCDSWTVFVSDETTLDLVLQLSPTMDPDQFTRCIEFGFYANCVEAPEIFKEELVFGPPWDFPGHATYEIKVPKGQYACITARDQVHTLRSVADIECGSNGHLSAEFKGDPFFGGNWLIGGNLDGSHVIDILDFGVLVSQYLKPGDVNNTCDEIKADGYRDADINADGVVDSLDYAFIQGNFLEEDKDSCCPDDGGTAGNGPVYTSVTVQQLREMGKADLAVADLNRDGVLDGADMEAFQAGVVPAPARHAPKSSR